MDRLRQLIAQINAQLSVLNTSQRVALGLCAALIVVSILWLLQWSTAPDMVPIVSQKMTYDQLDAAEEALDAKGATYEVRGNRIFARSVDKHDLIRVLHTGGALPEGAPFDINKMLADESPFQSPEARRRNYWIALGNEFAKVIATYNGVRTAHVFITAKSKRRLGAPNVVPTASVSLAMTAGRTPSREMVDGVAGLVAGGVPGLKKQNVTITDAGGRAYRVPDEDETAGFGYHDEIRKQESRYLGKILEKLSYIPGVRATVTVELDRDKRVTIKNEYSEAELKTETTKSETMGSGGQPAESGVQPNTGTALTAGGGSRTSTKDDTTTENFDPKLIVSETVESGRYAVKRVLATVGIPRSFIGSLYRVQNPDADAPKDDDAAFVALRDAQMRKVTASVAMIIGDQAGRNVQVDVDPDMNWTNGGESWSTIPGGIAVAGGDDGGGAEALSLLKLYGPQLGLGVLAMFSLFMMTRIARKSAIASPEPTSQGEDIAPESDAMLSVGPHPVGQAEASEGFLTAREVDDDTLKYQQLSDEVSKMVGDDPNSAAELLRQWINESD
ncbi:MAG: hypothetical protein IID36_04875 [Planctomycetes bacterium]|nr:hypothetical protein [Planctomycetota bacterium]